MICWQFPQKCVCIRPVLSHQVEDVAHRLGVSSSTLSRYLSAARHSVQKGNT
ncbi:hypothetical protein [Candidatus Williamhamiltonella defendens]|uniref:hypothetical protein n=1 Tax=Candidatus Williamhamiltonella defendens TaxID=138072 RepID=UPI0013147274|nr:hypothetical protein [Candidatus Hamiltonella defensa]